ncbi:hypothetical protein Scep_026312 [Stephania cephalantha]|uniref:Uncharacterized protein n=1 Tax=Stephania cephalantha TaxID=152367 RepID=A0AAP0HN25_9MAGN
MWKLVGEMEREIDRRQISGDGIILRLENCKGTKGLLSRLVSEMAESSKPVPSGDYYCSDTQSK